MKYLKSGLKDAVTEITSKIKLDATSCITSNMKTSIIALW
jgi:hypothetical protein